MAGLLLIVIQLDGPADLWLTDYGRLLLAKLLAVSVLFGLALVNRYRLTPLMKLRPAEASARLRRSVLVELAMVAIVFGIVAGWRFTPPRRSLNDVGILAGGPNIPPDFVEHFHTTNLAAFVTVSPAAIGEVSTAIELLTAEGEPLGAMELEVALANPDAGIEPIKAEAALGDDGIWRAVGFYLPVPGSWTITVTALISDFDRRTVSGQVIIVASAPGPR